MPKAPRLAVLLFSNENTPRWMTANPRKLIVKSGFGALKRRCWLELYNEDADAAVQLGDRLAVEMEGVRAFEGAVTQIRLDHEADHLSLYAENDPGVRYDVVISRELVGVTATQALENLVEGTGLSYQPDPVHAVPFERFEFSQHSLLMAIDLMSKLAGNWRWDLSDRGELRFRPFGSEPDRVILLKRDRFGVNLWRTSEDRYRTISIEAGLVDGEELHETLSVPELGAEVIGSSRVYARPIVTADAFYALRCAVLAQMSAPHYSHFVDWIGAGWEVEPGETVRFVFDEPFPLFPSDRIFRVAGREITWAHDSIQTRFALTAGYESSGSYFDYLKNDRRAAFTYFDGRVGSFQLDISSLDSAAHLDAA
ncbi:MAG: hypothetical protein GC154_06360 [bacterium]|nr:hypothetical protein [bacterium]